MNANRKGFWFLFALLVLGLLWLMRGKGAAPVSIGSIENAPVSNFGASGGEIADIIDEVLDGAKDTLKLIYSPHYISIVTADKMGQDWLNLHKCTPSGRNGYYCQFQSGT